MPDIEAFKGYLNKDDISDTDIKKEFKELISEVNKKLPNYKHIKDFKVVENEFEKTTTQKIKRFSRPSFSPIWVFECNEEISKAIAIIAFLYTRKWEIS